MVKPQARYAGQCIRRIVVLHDGPNPSTDIYLRNRLMAADFPPVDFIDITTCPDDADGILSENEDGVFVIVCRYISADWLRALEGARQHLAGLAFFVDDDLPAMLTDRSLPLRYRFRIWRRYARHVDRLSALASQLWVATPALENKYSDNEAVLLPPLYVDSPPESERMIRYFYHGTASHGAEQRFLAEVVREVQRRDPRMLFEIVGDSETRELFRDIERVVVLHPMDWRSYLAYSGSVRQDIGLAPLFESPVNAARSHSKVYDITRIGAVGIYSERAPYTDFIRAGEDGVLLPDDAGQWADAILDLAANSARRRSMALAARARCPAGDDSFRDLFGESRQHGLAQAADSRASK
jgi:hypothetical protein